MILLLLVSHKYVGTYIEVLEQIHMYNYVCIVNKSSLVILKNLMFEAASVVWLRINDQNF